MTNKFQRTKFSLSLSIVLGSCSFVLYKGDPGFLFATVCIAAAISGLVGICFFINGLYLKALQRKAADQKYSDTGTEYDLHSNRSI